MTRYLVLSSLVVTLVSGSLALAEKPFTDESSILGMTREDQTNDIKIKRLKKEVTLMDAIKVLTTYRVVTYDQYLEYAHQSGAFGTVTLSDDKTYKWQIEMNYAAVVTLPNGAGKVYLMQPDLKIREAKPKK